MRLCMPVYVWRCPQSLQIGAACCREGGACLDDFKATLSLGCSLILCSSLYRPQQGNIFPAESENWPWCWGATIWPHAGVCLVSESPRLPPQRLQIVSSTWSGWCRGGGGLRMLRLNSKGEHPAIPHRPASSIQPSSHPAFLTCSRNGLQQVVPPLRTCTRSKKACEMRTLVIYGILEGF